MLQRERPGVRLVNFGHLGDGNLHYNLQAPIGCDAAAYVRDQEDSIASLVYDLVREFGESISAEHGIGQLKMSELERHKSAVALDMMQGVKLALDPKNLLNPGRLLPSRVSMSPPNGGRSVNRI